MLRCEWKHRKYQCFLTLVKKNTVNYSVFGHLTLKNHSICSGFCFSPRKNTVNKSNFAVFSCFSLFFELRWSAIHGYQILRVFFSDNQYFRMFLVSMADIIGSYERCGAGGCRREATWICSHMFNMCIFFVLLEPLDGSMCVLLCLTTLLSHNPPNHCSRDRIYHPYYMNKLYSR